MSDGLIEEQTYMAQGIPMLGIDGIHRDGGWGRLYEFALRDDDFSGALIFSNIADGSYAGLSFNSSSSGADANFEGGYFAYNRIGAGGQFTFYLNDSIGTAGVSFLALCLDSGGFVGIGTDSPGSTLDVLGDNNNCASISASGTDTTTLELGGRITGDATTYIDIHSQAGVDYSLRIISTAGNNVISGAGNLSLASTSGIISLAGLNGGPFYFYNTFFGTVFTPAYTIDVSDRTDGIAMPKGTTAQRPGAPPDGTIRFNTTTVRVEAYYGGVWNNL